MIADNIYPFDEWEIREPRFSPEMNDRNETEFSIGNGYIGTRGTFEEETDLYHNGTYINGFYETMPIVYGEPAYGYAEKSQTMLNITNGKRIKLFIDGEPFDLSTGKIISYERKLRMREGYLSRSVTWASPSGKQVEIKINRIASFTHKHLMAISYSVRLKGESAEIKLISEIDGDVRNEGAGHDPRIGSPLKGRRLQLDESWADETMVLMRHHTRSSGLSIVCAMQNILKTESPYTVESSCDNMKGSVCFQLDARSDQEIELVKFIAYHTSDNGNDKSLVQRGVNSLREAVQLGFDQIQKEQEEYLARFWYRSDIEIDGDPALQQSIRFNLFHLLQSTGTNGATSIAAKGLTGEGYEGHYFWDTEIYVLPFFIYSTPEIARKLLEYRFSILDKARDRAVVMSQKGALYPWRTINGDEASAYFLAGTAQYHINADIAFGLKKYIDITGDNSILKWDGAEMLFETARLWADLGHFNEDREFCIDGVTGPDEYTALVNNNLYTNIMAREHLRFAYRISLELKKTDPAGYSSLSEKIDLSEKEVEDWKTAAENTRIPFNKELGIHPQDDTFLDKARWDFKGTLKSKYPLLLHFHPLVIYRYQVIKQTDLVLAEFLQGQFFSLAQKKRDFDYYDPLTTGDSSLSACIQGVMASAVGYHDKAYHYFLKTSRIDLDDVNGNVKDGVHTASMAGTWISLVYGFGGMRDYDGKLSFSPRIPDTWNKLKFKLTVRDTLLEVNISKDKVVYNILEGNELSIMHDFQEIRIKPGKAVVRSILP